MAYEVALGWSRNVRASWASCFSPATTAGGGATFFFAGVAASLFFAAADVFAERFFARCAGVCACMGNAAAITSNNNGIEIARLWKRAASLEASLTLLAQDRGGIGICSKRVWIAAGQNFNHPIIEIIHWMRLYSQEPAIVFFVGLLNVITQS